MADWQEILVTVLVSGGLLTGVLGWLFNWLGQRRHYRQTLETKMVERITALTELYHVHVWRATRELRQLLGGPLSDVREREIAFLGLTEYLHQVDRLRQERPEPLLLDLRQAHLYLHKMAIVAENLPFGQYEVSSLLDRYRGRGESPLLPHLFVDAAREIPGLRALFDTFCGWCDECECSPYSDRRCRRHQAAMACLEMEAILIEQNHALHTHWRKEPFRRRLGQRLRGLGRRFGRER